MMNLLSGLATFAPVQSGVVGKAPVKRCVEFRESRGALVRPALSQTKGPICPLLVNAVSP